MVNKRHNPHDSISQLKGNNKDEGKPQQPIARPPECLGQQKRQTPPIVRYETVRVLCGHDVPFGLFEDRKDRYRDARRKKRQSKKCPLCIKEDQQREMEAAVGRRKQKKKAKQDVYQQLRTERKDRLPDKSVFNVMYDATKVQWEGTLCISLSNKEESITFRDSASAVYKLLGKLDLQWRVWLDTHNLK